MLFSVAESVDYVPSVDLVPPDSVGFAADQGNSLFFGSLAIQENIFLKISTNPIFSFPFFLSLRLPWSVSRFGHTPLPCIHINSPLSLRSFFSLSEPRKLVKVLVPAPGAFLSISSNFSSIEMHSCWGCLVVWA
ncbi:hypothetical protein COP2_003431 [Malus domestica]